MVPSVRRATPGGRRSASERIERNRNGPRGARTPGGTARKGVLPVRGKGTPAAYIALTPSPSGVLVRGGGCRSRPTSPTEPCAGTNASWSSEEAPSLPASCGRGLLVGCGSPTSLGCPVHHISLLISQRGPCEPRHAPRRWPGAPPATPHTTSESWARAASSMGDEALLVRDEPAEHADTTGLGSYA
jgi:hypothetical protein